jgi:hypothetical protein
MENYIVKNAHCRYYNKPCLILLASCTLVACDNYITTHYKLTKLQGLYKFHGKYNLYRFVQKLHEFHAMINMTNLFVHIQIF